MKKVPLGDLVSFRSLIDCQSFTSFPENDWQDNISHGDLSPPKCEIAIYRKKLVNSKLYNSKFWEISNFSLNLRPKEEKSEGRKIHTNLPGYFKNIW
jgi:hypothetical protein